MVFRQGEWEKHAPQWLAVYENEVRSERIRAGQAAARANGKHWGGSRRGRRKKVTVDQEKIIRQMRAEGSPITRIARALRLSRPTIYAVLMVAYTPTRQPKNRSESP